MYINKLIFAQESPAVRKRKQTEALVITGGGICPSKGESNLSWRQICSLLVSLAGETPAETMVARNTPWPNSPFSCSWMWGLVLHISCLLFKCYSHFRILSWTWGPLGIFVPLPKCGYIENVPLSCFPLQTTILHMPLVVQEDLKFQFWFISLDWSLKSFEKVHDA